MINFFWLTFFVYIYIYIFIHYKSWLNQIFVWFSAFEWIPFYFTAIFADIFGNGMQLNFDCLFEVFTCFYINELLGKLCEDFHHASVFFIIFLEVFVSSFRQFYWALLYSVIFNFKISSFYLVKTTWLASLPWNSPYPSPIVIHCHSYSVIFKVVACFSWGKISVNLLTGPKKL